jgi:nucleoside kinase
MIHVVGHTATDHICRVPKLPARHESTYITDHQIYFGGGAANIAAGIARLGEEITLISAVGKDFIGSDYDRWMDDLGIHKDLFIVDGERTPTAYMFTDEQGDQVTYFEWGASATFAHQEAPALDFVHLATADPDFNVRVAQKSSVVSFDPGQDLLNYSRDQLCEILAHTFILFANRHEIDGVSKGIGQSEESIVRGVPIAVITMDAQGSNVYVDGERHFVPVVPVRLVDPTGAGDAYRAGFLTGYMRGYTPVECARIGTVTASFVVEKPGCQTNLPDWGMMRERYRQHFGLLEERDDV